MGSPVKRPLNIQVPLLWEKAFWRLVLNTIFNPASIVWVPLTQLKSSVSVSSRSEAWMRGWVWVIPMLD